MTLGNNKNKDNNQATKRNEDKIIQLIFYYAIPEGQ